MRLLYLEPFETGSHAAFTHTVTSGIDAQWTVLTLPGRFWKWRMRSCAVHWALAEREALTAGHDAVLASAYVPLAELRGLVPELASVPTLLYFHENQAAYPDPHAGERDHHYALTQLVACLAAQHCAFNSNHNRDSLLTEGARLLDRMPERAPASWLEQIRANSSVLGYPCAFTPCSPTADTPTGRDRAAGPLILWNHRWEHDKNPAAFFKVLQRLDRQGGRFRLAVCGASFRQVPPEFTRARATLAHRIVHWGHLPRAEYLELLGRCQLVVSTAHHEFFGVAVLEAVHHGAHALVPDRLSYPELLPKNMRYRDDEQLLQRLVGLCGRWTRGELDLRADRSQVTAPHSAAVVLPRLRAVLERLVSG